MKVLVKYKPYFAQFEMDVGLCPLTQVKIETKGEPRAQRYRSPAIAVEEEVDTLIKAMLKYKIIEPSESNWSSNLVIVGRKDSKRIRLCNDLSELNKAIINMPQIPIPHFEETYLKLQGAKWFCCIDLANAYWNLAIDPKYRDRTAFFAGDKLYQYCRMPFGLASAPAFMNQIISKLLHGTDAIVYFDDIICCAETWEGMVETLDKVLYRITVKGGFKFRVNKCLFGLDSNFEIRWLGSIICRDQIKMQADKVKAIVDWKAPENLKQLQAFLGICNFYRMHIKRFAEIAVPLYDLTKKPKDAPKGKLSKAQLAKYFKWSKLAQRAFDSIKKAICTAPALALPCKYRPFILTTDASNVALGGVLSQKYSSKVRKKRKGRIYQVKRYYDVVRICRITAKPKPKPEKLDRVLRGGDNPDGTKSKLISEVPKPEVTPIENPDTTKVLEAVDSKCPKCNLSLDGAAKIGCSNADQHSDKPQYLQEGVEYAVAYYSRRLTPAEARNYSTPEVELLAGIGSFLNFYMFLAYSEFEWRTDSKCLCFAERYRDANSRIFRLGLLLDEMRCTITHMSATSSKSTASPMLIADYLSRAYEASSPAKKTYKDVHDKRNNLIETPSDIPQGLTIQEFREAIQPYLKRIDSEIFGVNEGTPLVQAMFADEPEQVAAIINSVHPSEEFIKAVDHYYQRLKGDGAKSRAVTFNPFVKVKEFHCNAITQVEDSREGRLLYVALTPHGLDVETLKQLQKEDGGNK
jgi:hypothetical protein